MFTNKELEREFDTVEKLQAAERLGPFLTWIRKQKPWRNFKTRTSRT